MTTSVPDLLLATVLDHDLLEAVEAGETVWSLTDLHEQFEIVARRATGYLIVERLSDHVLGTVRFTRTHPRHFWGWKELAPEVRTC